MGTPTPTNAEHTIRPNPSYRTTSHEYQQDTAQSNPSCRFVVNGPKPKALSTPRHGGQGMRTGRPTHDRNKVSTTTPSDQHSQVSLSPGQRRNGPLGTAQREGTRTSDKRGRDALAGRSRDTVRQGVRRSIRGGREGRGCVGIMRARVIGPVAVVEGLVGRTDREQWWPGCEQEQESTRANDTRCRRDTYNVWVARTIMAKRRRGWQATRREQNPTLLRHHSTRTPHEQDTIRK